MGLVFMNNFQRKVVSVVKKFYDNYNCFTFTLELDGEQFSIPIDKFYYVSEDNECVIIPDRKVFIAARRAIKSNKKIEECFNGLSVFKIDLKKLDIEIADEECGCSYSCGNYKNCSCHDELTITSEDKINE